MWQRTKDILEMIRFSHTVFALPFAMLSAVMAWTTPTVDGSRMSFSWQHLLGLLLCMVTARSAAMAFNRLVDRRIDAENPRTKQRHLPAGVLSVRAVTLFIGLTSAAFVASTLLFLPNRLPILLSLPVLLFLLGYSYTKRFTSLAHYWLGVALMLAPVSTWIALRGELLLTMPSDILPAVLLGVGVLLWVGGFDVIYACQDAEFDTRARLRSIPARLGVVSALRLALASHLAMVVVMLSLPYFSPQLGLGPVYLTGIGLVASLLLYEHWLVRPDDLTRVNVAFFHVNAIISIGIFLTTTFDLLT